MLHYRTYFVLNGLHNGEDGNEAKAPDGWYWIMDGDEEGNGPFVSMAAAKAAADSDSRVLKRKQELELWFKLLNLGGFRHKATTWNDVGEPIPMDLLRQLELYNSDELNITERVGNSFHTQYKKLPPVFLVHRKGGIYLVDTEGYTYARKVRYVGPSSMLNPMDVHL